MTFEDYWDEVEELKILPMKAIKQVPSSLKDDTKKKMMKLEPRVTAEKLSAVIDEINHGSIESIEVLLRKRL